MCEGVKTIKKLKFIFNMLYYIMQRLYQQKQQQQLLQSVSIVTMEMGLPRMSDEDYSSEFGTPRPGTDRQCAEMSAGTSRWMFSHAAKQQAQEMKRRIVSCTKYRMAVSKHVKLAFDQLEKSIARDHSMSEADFRAFKKAIMSFDVNIKVFDKTLRSSQHAKIMPATGFTLRNILSSKTITTEFESLEKLTDAVRCDLSHFLASDTRAHDRAAVLEQMKEESKRARSDIRE